MRRLRIQSAQFQKQPTEFVMPLHRCICHTEMRFFAFIYMEFEYPLVSPIEVVFFVFCFNIFSVGERCCQHTGKRFMSCINIILHSSLGGRNTVEWSSL